MSVLIKLTKWCLFIDSSKEALLHNASTYASVFVCAMLHYVSTYASVPVSHSVALKYTYSTIQRVFQKLCDNELKWAKCVGLKMVNIS